MTSTAALEDRVRAALDPHLLVVRGIGTGGMGAVFLAREPALKRTVAVKVLAPDLAATPEARARFEREAQAVAGLSHPNIVNVHGVGELDDGTPYFVMQYVSGRSLAARLADDGPLPVAEARRMLGEVASALAAAHAKGIIHRDIKPANILCDEESGRALVGDFGIAAVTAAAAGGTDMRLTQTGMLVGTPQYMSPEQLLSEPPSAKTDIYALGLLGYEMLAGEAPFHGSTPHELIAAHLRDTPRKLSDLRDDVDPETESLIAACLSKQATQRPTAAELAQRLAPGAGALLEWPPPGLEDLHGAGRAVFRRAAIGSTAVLAGLLPLLLAGPALGAASTSAFSLLLLVLTLTGIAILLAAARSALRTGARSARAVQAGYGWLTVAETALDSAGDTGHLITGTGRYAPLPPERRSLLRRFRLYREAVRLAAALLPLPLLMFVAFLGGRGWLAPRDAWLAVALPVILLLVAGRLGLVERRSVQRRTASRRGRPRGEATRLAEPWNRAFDAVNQRQALGRGPVERAALGRAAGWLAVAVTLLVGWLALPIVATGVFGPLYWTISVPKFANTLEKLRIANVTRPYVVARDSAISLEAAGRAYAAIVSRGHSPGPVLRPVPPPEPVPWDSDLAENLFPSARPREYRGPFSQEIIPAARRGFSRDELRYLERVAHASIWRDVATVARAPAVDIVGARYVIPFAPTTTPFELPIPHFANTKTVAYAAAARAAYHLAQGRSDSAENALREIVSFGFAMTEGSTLIETLIGVVIVGIARHNLMQLWTLTGDPRGPRLRAALDSVLAAREAREAVEAGMQDRFLNPAAMRYSAMSGATNPRGVRSLRLELLMTLGMSPCTNASELVFGHAPDVRNAFAQARRELVRFPSESSLVDMLETTPERLRFEEISGPVDAVVSRAGRVSGWLLGNPRLGGCSRIIGLVMRGMI